VILFKKVVLGDILFLLYFLQLICEQFRLLITYSNYLWITYS